MGINRTLSLGYYSFKGGIPRPGGLGMTSGSGLGTRGWVDAFKTRWLRSEPALSEAEGASQ